MAQQSLQITAADSKTVWFHFLGAFLLTLFLNNIREHVSKSIKLATVTETIIKSTLIKFLPTILKDIHTISFITSFTYSLNPIMNYEWNPSIRFSDYNPGFTINWEHVITLKAFECTSLSCDSAWYSLNFQLSIRSRA